MLVIRPGTYKISAPLKVKSNTTVVAYGCTFNRGAAINNLIRNDADGTTGGYGANSGITLLGGTWDGQYSSFSGTACSLMAFGHCTNVTVRDAAFQNTTAWHFVEFNACKDGVVDNCTFAGGAEQSLTTQEAVQIDAAIDAGAFPWFGPYDNTPCLGITVSNSRFGSCGSGVGTHSDPASAHQDIKILNNTFDDCYFDAVRG